MRIEAAATTISWIPSEAITGPFFKLPFEMDVNHYDDPPPDTLPDVDAYLAADRARFSNKLRAWIEVRDGEVVDFGHAGGGAIGATTFRLGRRRMTFAAHSMPDVQRAERVGTGAVRFEQTAGGRTGAPMPRRVSHAPYAQIVASLAWTTLAVTLHADGRQDTELVGASPFPRHWVYGPDGALAKKTATIDFHEWNTASFGRHTPWGDVDSPAVVRDVETALERELSLQIMRAGRKPQIRRLAPGDRLTVQHEPSDEIYLLLDGVLRVDVDGEPLAELGPGVVVGERAGLEGGTRTATLVAVTGCLVAAADPRDIEPDALRRLSDDHRREDDG
jgi:hypothetical protein